LPRHGDADRLFRPDQVVGVFRGVGDGDLAPRTTPVKALPRGP
jgi:hypothetical protein